MPQTQTSTIQIRIDEKTKQRARKTLESAGLDLSSGIKLFLYNVAITKSFPLQIKTANGFTPKQEALLLKETELAIKHGKRYDSVRKLLDDI